MIPDLLKQAFNRQSDSNSLPPARLNPEQVGNILGFKEHDIPILVAEELLKPLGTPVPNSTKYFATIDIFKCYPTVGTTRII